MVIWTQAVARIALKTVCIAFSCALFGLCLADNGLAQDKPKPATKTKPQPGWAVTCADKGKGLACKATQTISLRKTGQRLLSVTVRRTSGKETAAMLLRLPHGLFLPAGVQIKVDDSAPKSLVVQTCDRNGCYAGTSYKAKETAAVQAGKVLAIVFQNLKKKSITVQMPLAGFREAYAKLK